MDIKHGRYSNRTSLTAKITCGVLWSYDRVDQFPKTRRKVGFVTAGVEINRGCTRRTRPVEIETEPGTFVQTKRGPKRYPRTIHFSILFRYGPYRYCHPAVTGNIVRCPYTSLSLELVSHRTKAHLVWHYEIPGFHEAHHIQVHRKYVLY